ncbi:hypothetical protein [Anaeromyxobacter paludicola]|uniref:EF-hand domain-containing protein n=1 Tax=Anaeromyxobacter paludicola TaxID=2918171 RepID=A0ABM7X989_9BACT|nr:hypothetical protein [Anaeromyxobacter paludicola]BDG08387.1 hypothetical protein AMPC_15000 [Anaeromyxobacter paludicola]
MTLKQLTLALPLLGTLALGLPARAAAPSNTDLPRSIGELMKMKPMEVMHLMDPDKKGMVTKEQYLKFFEDLWNRMDQGQKGMVMKDAWMSGYSARNK